MDARGVESMPMALIIGLMLGACALGLGTKCLANLQKTTELQRGSDSFDSLIREAKIVSLGGLGGSRLVELELSEGKIVVRDRLAQLIIDGEVRRSGILPLPIVGDSSKSEIEGGWYSLELRRDAPGGGYILRLRRVEDGRAWGAG